MRLPSPRRVKAWLIAAVSLIAVTVVSVAPMIRSRAQSLPTSYTITDLGPSGGTESKAFAINSCGQFAGYATFGGSSKRPFFRTSTSLIDLGVLSGDGIATSLNNSGYVVGYSPTAGSTDRAFIWHDDNGNNANDSGEMKELLPAGAKGAAQDINDNGRVVGWVDSMGGDSLGFSAFTWDPNQTPNFQIISGSPAHPSPLAYGINNAGAIVGEDSTLLRGFILRGGLFTDIPWFTGGNRSVAYAVSEAGHVVGAAAVDSTGDPTLHAITWTDEAGLKDLGVLSGDNRSEAYGVATVDGSLRVVGSSWHVLGTPPFTVGPKRAFVWQDLNSDGDGVGDPTEMKDLLSLVPDASGWTRLTEARSINSSGQIVGFGVKNGETHAFLLTPAGVTPPACLPIVNISVSPSAVNEDAGASMTYTFKRSIVTASPLNVSFSTTGTAVPNDYAISSFSTVQIPANMASVAVTVTPTADTTDEPNETVTLSITADPLNYTVGAQNAATGTITDEDPTPTILITNVTAAEPTSGLTDFVFTVTLTNPSSSQITVNYDTTVTGATTPATGGSSCGAGIDFVNLISGTLTFPANETSKQVSVTVCSDNNLEPDETFFVNLSGNSANSLLPANTKGTGTITPQAPIVFVEQGTENNPIPTAVAIDSVTFVRGPFRLTNEWNLTPSDRATRIILFTSNLGMTQADLATGILSIHVAGYGAIPLPNIENVGSITGLNASFIIVKLPADLNPLPGPNNLTLTVKMGSASSNATLLGITP